jgi:hypothetical protein
VTINVSEGDFVDLGGPVAHEDIYIPLVFYLPTRNMMGSGPD